jgi:hypothetical protein
MMATTHAAVGVALAALLLPVAPELAPVAAVAAVAGGIAPDLDLAWTHRRTLHFPVFAWPPTLAALAVAAATVHPAAVAVAFFLLAAAVHATSDVLAGGAERRPWERTTDDAVFCHLDGRWWPARRWVRYAGAPEDLAMLAAAALPGLLLFDGPVRTLVAAGVAFSAGFTAIQARRAGDLPWRLTP